MSNSLSVSKLLIQKAFIAGDWIDNVDGTGEKKIEVRNPADHTVIGTVPVCTIQELKTAIKAAEAVFASWSEQPAKERSNILKAWQKLILENQSELAQIITAEQGKPLAEANTEVISCASYIEWFAEEAKRAYGDIIPSNRKNSRINVLKQPVGVVATITPWNFPALMLVRKVAAAFAAGCSVVSKSSELTPFSALALAKLAEEAGLPKGVWSVFNGDPQTLGFELCTNPAIKKLSFTGSTRTGKLLLRQCADTVKKVSMELGGNAPFIVFESADIEKAAGDAIFAKFRNAGQTCICVNRFYVHEKVYDQFKESFIGKIRKLVAGPGNNPEVTVGPLINQAAVEKVETQIKDALSKGAKICLGGKRSDLGFTFFEPTVIETANSSMLLAHEETFGPLVALFRFKDENEAVSMANDSEVGLASYFYSRDYAQVQRVMEKLQTGMVGVNEVAITTENAPFGGIKESGFGREGSKYGLEEFLQPKYICLGGL